MPKLHYFQESLPYQSLLEKLQVVESSVAIETAPYICIKQPGLECH